MNANPARRRAYRRGRLSETLAGLLLRLKGYRILDRRYRTPVGEIDLIAYRRGLLVFVEVKARADWAHAAESLSAHQKRRLRRAAEAYLARHAKYAGGDVRFDAILLARRAWPRHLENIWDLG